MPRFSESSKAKLSTCMPDLQRLMNAVIEKTDITILCGYRSKNDQDKAFAEGKSKLKWPNGQHNKYPSNAVDVAPYPIDWNDVDRFKQTAEVIKETAAELGIDVRWGGDWITFQDLPHWELPRG